MSKAVALRKVRKELVKYGMLLQSDAKLPSIAGLVAQEPIKGSWWGHPAGNTIFNICSDLADDPDVLVMRLVVGKVTFVHRKLWPSIVAIATAGETWQLAKLGKDHKTLLSAVEKSGELRSDQLPPGCEKIPKFGGVVRDLEKRLLIVAEEIHTESGAHAKILRSWRHWAEIKQVTDLPSAEDAQLSLTQAVAALGPGLKSPLPWI